MFRHSSTVINKLSDILISFLSKTKLIPLEYKWINWWEICIPEYSKEIKRISLSSAVIFYLSVDISVPLYEYEQRKSFILFEAWLMRQQTLINLTCYFIKLVKQNDDDVTSHLDYENRYKPKTRQFCINLKLLKPLNIKINIFFGYRSLNRKHQIVMMNTDYKHTQLHTH